MIFKLILFIVFAFLFSQCGKDNLPENRNYRLLKNVNFEKELAKGIGGRYVPAKMNEAEPLKILVVYAQFKEDSLNPKNDDWPLNKLPKWKNEFIAENVSEIPRKPFSMSNYFYEMSYGQNLITGYIYPELVVVDTPASIGFGKANEFILKKIDKKINFRDFDKWTLKTDYKRFGEPDNFVDAVYIIYRYVPNVTWGGIAMLSTYYKSEDGPIVTSRIPTISMTLNLGKKGDYSYTNKLTLLAHEYGHYLIGENHNFEPELTSGGKRQRGIGLMPGNWGTLAMNPQEKFLAGYINFSEVFENQIGELPDFQMSGKAYRIPIPIYKDGNLNRDPTEYFIIANHQRKSIYEQTKGTGIYIYHVRSKLYGQNHIDVVCADGLWQWKIEDWVKRPEGIGGPTDFFNKNKRGTPLTEKMPYMIPEKVDRKKGRDELHEVLYSGYMNDNRKEYWWDRWVDENGNAIEDPIGDSADAFNIGYNEIFSPWSNPATLDQRGNPVYTTVQLLENNDGVFKIQFYVDSVSSMKAPPSKPQNVILNNESKNGITIKWEPNIEPDMRNGFYNIYRSENSKNNFKLIDKFNSGNFEAEFFTYIDKNIRRGARYYYHISAVDNSGKESVRSDVKEVLVK